MSFDTRYRIKIKNHCGAIESDWKDFIFDTLRKSSCPILSGQRIRLTEKVDTFRLTYIKNPTLPISGPYLWRYKRSGYSEWLDSLITDSIFVDFPLNLPVDRPYSVEVKSLFYPGCAQSTNWSVSVEFWKKCLRPENKAFTAKAVSNQSIEVSIDRNQLYPDAEVWYEKQGAAFSQKIKLDQKDTLVKLMNLSPNTLYEVRVCNVCTPSGNLVYYNCSEKVTLPTPKYFVPEPISITAKKDQKNRGELIVIPNPTDGLFSIQLPNGALGNASLYVLNLNGQSVYRAQLELSSATVVNLNLSEQPEGVYHVFLSSGGHLFQNKLVLIK